ncbi:MAG: DUF1028 domain-containing protein [Candidatus Binataceae bacterium]
MNNDFQRSDLAATYSIVARDPASGRLGVAVQSHYFSVGSVVSWAEAGVGAVATQSFVDPSYGPLGLDLMRSGRSAPDALAGLVAADSGREVRQVAMVDANGVAAAHTGAMCIAEAGHITGEGFSVQANMMHRNTVWHAMAEAYRGARGDLADRLMAALDAAEGEGGDVRGMQSAAMLIVDAASTGRPWAERVIEIRVEDAPQPLVELRRLLGIRRAYQYRNAAEVAFARGDIEAGNREYQRAEELIGDNPEMQFWHAVALVNAGRVDDALPLFKSVFARDRRWLDLAENLPAVRRLPSDAAVMAKIRSAAS